jgi:hypothetical protein
MRCTTTLFFVLALGLMGCGQDLGPVAGAGGSGGVGGDGGTGGTTGQEFPCTEQGIRDAIAEGGGPHTFSCAEPQTVETDAEIVIDNDVVLDGEGNLIVDGNDDHIVFVVAEGATAELTGFAVTRGRSNGGPPLYRFGGCIMNQGTLALTNCTVSRCTAAENPDPERYNEGGGIANSGSLTLKNTTVSENSSVFWGGGISNGGTLALTNSTVSGNTVAESVGLGFRSGGGISNNGGTLTLTNSTISGNTAEEYTAVQNINEGTLTVTGSVIDGTCGSETVVTSVGHNIESPGNTCGFDTNKGDQINVSAEDLNLGLLQDNGGPTMTHALQTVPVVSAAIDQIPEADCGVTTDQRGVLRPQGPACDVGAFELEAGP